MSQLYNVTLMIQPNPIVQQTVEYRWLERTWFNVTENRHTGDNTLTHLALPNIVEVKFGDQLTLTKHQWQAVGSPLLLTLSEIQTIKNVLGTARHLDKGA